MVQVTTLGAILGLTIAIFLIIKKVQPVYSLFLGALLGGLIGGANLESTVGFMIAGVRDIVPAIVRIITAGILAGVLIQSGAATKIAESIVNKLGKEYALIALAISTLLLTSIGVFVDVSVITVAPIALVVGKKAGLSKSSILLAMIGGGKAGNMMSPNPNTIAGAEAFNVPLSSLMTANIVPAICGLIVTIILAKLISKKGEMIKDLSIEEEKKTPNLIPALIGPFITVLLLALRPITTELSKVTEINIINIDPLVALPLGGLIGCIAMGKIKHINEYMTYGLQKMTGVAVLLIGTGAVAGIIKVSELKNATIAILENSGLPAYLLAPISGIVMSAATASTTAGTSVASATFAPALIIAGVKGLYAAAMIHTGATVLDHLPHGSFFHATGGATDVKINERLKLIPYETLIGFTMVIISTIMYGVIL